ncbi:MAG: UbiA family prenyltransferase [Planctomycetota bacterium]|nr:UbiA family prenyltransferase [Planctomycetota bacterium]
MLRPWLRIVRLPLAPTAICDALACAAFAWCVADVDLTSLPAAAWWQLALTSFLIYCVGMAANDFADRDVDRVKDPLRPLPSGDLKPWAVALFLLVCIAGAVWLSGGPRGFGPTVIAAILCALLYDFGGAAKDTAAGPILLGLTRFANASIAVWPLVLDGHAPWAVLIAPLCVGLYAAGITFLSHGEDAPQPERPLAMRLLTVVAFCTAAVIVWVLGGIPTAGVAVAFGVSSSTLFGRTPKAGPVKRQVLEMLLGLYWLAAVIVGGAHDGALGTSLIVGFAALVVAWGLAVGSQLLIRWLRKMPPPVAPAGDGA